MLKKRLITSLWAIPLIIASVWLDRPIPWFTLLVGVFAVLAAFEFYNATGVSGVPTLFYFGLVWTLLFILSAHFYFSVPIILTSGVLLSMVLLITPRRKEGIFLNWAWMLAGMMYCGWLLSYLVALRLEGGKEWVFLALFATFGSDTTAYFIGRSFGRHKMAPQISPGKTWEGAVAGFFGAVAVSLASSFAFGLGLSFFEAAGLGLIISIAAQCGDLVESLFKRNTGIKDSGWLLPGHGGVLDRMDSIVFAGVAAYYFFLIKTMAGS